MRSDRLPIATDARWEFSREGEPEDWRAAELASDGPEPFPSSRQFPHAARALWQLLPLWLPLAAIAFVWDRRGWRRPTPAQLRWGLLAFWLALAVNYSTFWLDTYGVLPTEHGPWAPPWNLTPYLASPWLSLAPSLALALGALRALRPADGQPAQRLAERLAAGTVALYLAAILYLHLTVPFYCVAKGSYLAATTPLLAVLAASGFEAIGRSPWARGIAVSALVCWAANVVATYWVV